MKDRRVPVYPVAEGCKRFPNGSRVTILRPHLWAERDAAVISESEGMHRVDVDGRFSRFLADVPGQMLRACA